MKNVLGLTPFKRFCMTIGNLPATYIESLSYLELVYWLCDYIQEKVIPTINNNAGAVQELQNLFTELQNYVNNYFDNLDVQEEINNKLDEMAENGTLQEIVISFLKFNSIIVFDNVSLLKQATNLINGSTVKTLGYYSKNDNGNSDYIIRNKNINDIEDDGSILFLQNNLVAELIINNEINISQFGARGDGISDDTAAIQKCFEFVQAGMSVNFKKDAKYLITSTINIPKLINVNGNSCHIIINENFVTNSFIFNYGSYSAKQLTDSKSYLNEFLIKDFNFHFYGNSNLLYNCFYLFAPVQIKNIFTWGFNKVVTVSKENYIDKLLIDGIESWGKTGDGYVVETGDSGDANEIKNVHIHYENVKGTPNLVKFGNSLHGAIGKNLINGNILISGGNVILNNTHLELGNITINSARVQINSAYLWKPVGKNMLDITGNSYVELNNLLINYITERFDYSNDDCVDISFTNSCTVIINNCFKRMTGEGMSDYLHYMGLDTSSNNFNMNKVNNSIKSSSFNGSTSSPLITKPRTGSYGNFGTMYTLPNITWKGVAATYYYKAIMIYDKERLCGRNLNANELSVEVSENGKCPAISLNGKANSNYRIYRGTETSNYNKFSDISPISDRIVDNDVLVGGRKWESRESGGIDNILNCTNYINKGDNVEVWATQIPTVGSWKKGDIIINYNPSTNNPFGWMCTQDGTPGVWRKISSLSEN